MKKGRKPGSMVNAKCVCCGEIKPATSGSGFRCQACRDAGHIPPHQQRGTGKHFAGTAVAFAIRTGKLAAPGGLCCTDCGGAAIEYDHRDYNQPLLVEPVCRSCNLKRGPAIPLTGTIPHTVSLGGIPYKRRSCVESIMRRMGIATDALSSMPATLTLEHWRQLAPIFKAA